MFVLSQAEEIQKILKEKLNVCENFQNIYCEQLKDTF